MERIIFKDEITTKLEKHELILTTEHFVGNTKPRLTSQGFGIGDVAKIYVKVAGVWSDTKLELTNTITSIQLASPGQYALDLTKATTNPAHVSLEGSGRDLLEPYSPFIMTFETTGVDETLTIPCQDIGVFNCSIDWGDGSFSYINSFDDANLAHIYAVAGTYTVSIEGNFPNIFFNAEGDKDKLRTVVQLGNTGLISLEAAFLGCEGLTSIQSGECSTKLLTTMSQFAKDCVALGTLNIRTMDLSKVIAMYSLAQNTAITELTSGLIVLQV